MDPTMVISTLTNVLPAVNKIAQRINQYKIGLMIFLSLSLAVFAYIKPQQFIDLWLTRDQQGQLLFNQGHYAKAANAFENTQWQAFSNYGAEQYKNAVNLYGQFNDIDNQLAQANALAHGREYIKARNLYQKILQNTPSNKAAQTNLAIVQKIIDDINRLSASQKSEDGEAIKDLGDEPQTADGAERLEARKPKKIEQYSAEQLLLDPSLNKMWLRQVQKDPAHFLSQKFYMQQQLKEKQVVESSTQKTADVGDGDGGTIHE